MKTPLPEIVKFDSLAQCCTAIGDFLQDFIQASIDRLGHCTIALPGGKTPITLFQTLSRPPFSTSVCWSKVFFFFGDERFVPLNHPDSNFGMAKKNLLAQLPIADDHIFRMPAEIRPYAAAARHYQQTMAKVFGALTSRKQPYADAEYPAFDLVLLGMGTDGHTASLFPGHQALNRKDWVVEVVEVEVAQALPPVPRLTLTLPVINNADTALFLVSGAQKIRLAESFLSDPSKSRLPAALVRPRQRLLWYLVH